jgi:hypothetical protein
MTKASGKGRGGKRPNAGRPPKPTPARPPPDPAILDLSPEQIMERGMHHFALLDQWADAAKIAKSLATVRARAPAAPGKKQQAADLAQARTGEGGRFAPRPPPKLN